MNTVQNVSRPGIFAKLKTVERWVEQCAVEWVVPLRSFRELSHQERLQRMSSNLASSNRVNGSKRRYYGLPPINPSGEKELMPKSSVWTSRLKFDCLVQAQQWAQNV